MQAARAMHLPVAASYHTDIPGYADLWGLDFRVISCGISSVGSITRPI
jgi:hypothetical protein